MVPLIASVGRQMPKEQADAYRVALGDLTRSELECGVLGAIRNYKFAGFPPVAVIREHAGAVINDDEAALRAWSEVLKAMRTIGGYQSVRWSHAAIAAAIADVADSWAGLCETPSAELHSYVRPRFIASYKAAAKVQGDGEAVSRGILACDAGKFGAAEPDPVGLHQVSKPVTGFIQDRTERVASDESAKLPLVTFQPIPKETIETPDDADFELRRQRSIRQLERLAKLRGENVRPEDHGPRAANQAALEDGTNVAGGDADHQGTASVS